MNDAPAPPAPDCSDAASRLARFFETLEPHSVEALGEFYAADARFKDPFNDVRGIPAIAQVFRHMFLRLDNPRFVVTLQVVQGAQCFLCWEFHFGFRSMPRTGAQRILGATHLEFSPEGLVTLHRDYWDAAEELYEKLPLFGGLMRWLKRRARE